MGKLTIAGNETERVKAPF